MEVGAVKQAFNNELILMKKNLNQAKTQIIHKLTRKAKTLTEKKAADTIKEKLKRKAELAVKEVLEIKKIKPRDVAKFAITHTGELNSYLNKPTINQDRVCARILLHKSMQEKYKVLRRRFANIPIRDLFMSRQERLKLKKEEKERKKHKKEQKNNKSSNSGDWSVEDINDDGKVSNNASLNDDEDLTSDVEQDDEMNSVNEEGDEINSGNEKDDKSDLENDQDPKIDSEDEQNSQLDSDNEENGETESEDDNDSDITEKEPVINNKQSNNKKLNTNKKEISKTKLVDTPKTKEAPNLILPTKTINKPIKKHKENKNKNLNEKLTQRKFKKDVDDAPIVGNKVVDPFFVTSTGENYMSVAEPRQPDEFKEIHRQGNRKLRRAAMFGHVPKIKPKQNFDDNIFNNSKKDDFRNKSNGKFDKKSNFNNKDYDSKFSNKYFDDRNKEVLQKKEKLHPSWEAKKKQSGILPFQGKKIVFDES